MSVHPRDGLHPASDGAKKLHTICSLYCDPSIGGRCGRACFNFCSSFCRDQVTRHRNNQTKIIAGLAAATALCLVLLICYVIYMLRIRSRLRQETTLDATAGPPLMHPIWYISTVGLSPSAIASIAMFSYDKKKGTPEGDDCAVCLHEFYDGETLRLLPKCRHAFHVRCIDTWLESHTNCPLCRAPVVFPAQEDGNEEQQRGGGNETAESSGGEMGGEQGTDGSSRRKTLSRYPTEGCLLPSNPPCLRRSSSCDANLLFADGARTVMES